MPNIVQELAAELARVKSLLSHLDDESRRKAQGMLQWGREQMALNSYDGMRESIDDLRDFPEKKKA
jgi:hypothetical protein